MTNDEKIQRAEQLIAEANVLLNKVKANSNEEYLFSQVIMIIVPTMYIMIRMKRSTIGVGFR